MINIYEIKPNVISSNIEGRSFLFYGSPGTYKTTVANQFPNPIIMAMDIGYGYIENAMAVPVSSWTEFKSFCRQVKNPPKNVEPYKTVVLDGVDLLANMCEDFILRSNSASSLKEIPWGDGWTQFKKEFTKEVTSLTQNGLGVIFISHANIKEDQEGNIVSVSPKLSSQIVSIIDGIVDFSFFLNKEEDGNGKTTVYAYSDTASNIKSKARLNIDPRFEFTFKELQEQIKKGVEKKIEFYGKEIATDEKATINNSNKPTFEALKADVLKIATVLVNNEVTRGAATESVMRALNGTPISQTTELDYDSLESLLGVLQELNDKRQ